MKAVFLFCLTLATAAFADDVAQAVPSLMIASKDVLLFLGFIAIALGILGSGYALSISLGAYAATSPAHRAAAFLPAIMPSSQGLIACGICFYMSEKMTLMPLEAALAGVVCGLPCLFSAIGQAKTAAACIRAINNEQMDRGHALIVTSMPEIYALCGLIGAFFLLA